MDAVLVAAARAGAELTGTGGAALTVVSGTDDAGEVKGVKREVRRVIKMGNPGMAYVLVKLAGFDIYHANLTIMWPYMR
jgi:hypothetical protein